MIIDQQSALKIVKEILAADFCCEEADLDRSSVVVNLNRHIERARKFPLREGALAAATMGNGVAVVCTPERLQWSRKYLTAVENKAFFQLPNLSMLERYIHRLGQAVMGPHMKSICTIDTFRPFPSPKGVHIRTIERPQIPGLYGETRFTNALGYRDDPDRPRMLACSAYIDGEIVGMAAASADCEELWQVGIDTLSGYRKQGIGKALVSSLTEAIFAKEKLPYYSTQISNIASRRIAVALGYRPAWVELFTKNISE